MKKSSSIRLALMGSAAFALSACGEGSALPQDARYYPTIEACSADYGAQPCAEAKTLADATQAKEAPRFTQKQQCEAEFGVGNCETRQEAGGGSFFTPLLMGYMVGNMLGGNRYAQPIYRGPNNSAVMPRAGRLFNVGSFGATGTGAGATAAAFRPATQVAEVSRGGFGASARSYSTAGG